MLLRRTIINIFFAICALAVAFGPAVGQQLNTFNYNVENGLPSSHVYGVLRDHLGYLWVTTEKGVARYNGYEFKIFNQADGISNEDIYELSEDGKGRMWLSNISDELGYISNNKYHKAYIPGNYYTVFPKDIQYHNNGILFYSKNISGDGKLNICVENNDTIHAYSMEDWLPLKAKGDFYNLYIFNESGTPLVGDNRNNVYELVFDGRRVKRKLLTVLKRTPEMEVHMKDLFSGRIGNFLLFYSNASKSNAFYVASLNDGIIREIKISPTAEEEHINYIYFDLYGSENVFVITNKRLIQFRSRGDNFTAIDSFSIDRFIGDRDVTTEKLKTVHVDSFWGNCLGSHTNGLWLNYDARPRFILEQNIDLQDFSYVGAVADTLCFWWNAVNNTLMRLDRNGGGRKYVFPELNNIYNVSQYHGDTLMVNGVYNYLLEGRTGKLMRVDDRFPCTFVRSIIQDRPGLYYAVTNIGFAQMNQRTGNISYLNRDRYRGLLYDSARRSYWAYNYDRVFVHSPESDTLIDKDELAHLGVQKIQKVVIDNKYGNFFVEGNSNLVLYDADKRRYQELFTNFNLKESTVLIYRDVLVVVGRFGALFSKILGKDTISQPLYYPNLKNLQYNFVYNTCVLGGKLLFNTDKGTYSVAIPGDSEIINNHVDAALSRRKLVLTYGDSVRNFEPGDTVRLDQKNLRLQFDVINPFGNGKVRYSYRLAEDSAWRELNTNELTLPTGSHPDTYYPLYISTYDNVWRSSPVCIYLYIQPYWYQTVAGKRLVAGGVALLVLLFGAALILATRYWVTRANRRRNMRMELELKSIYSQINPHFIFNTLNSALLLVSKNRMEEAYSHISRFSRLLRAYIKSSRNKYITIEDEIRNLKDYIELQQARFKDKFDYDIVLGPSVEPHIRIPSLLLQPFVENAINHGLLLKKERGTLSVTFTSDKEADVICIIEDDGVGRKYSMAVNENDAKKEGSYGDLLIRDLVDIFNKFERMNISIAVTDKEGAETGTVVTIRIKNPRHAE